MTGTRPLIDGRIKPEGIELDIKVLRPREAFPRMLEKRSFIFRKCRWRRTSHSKAAAIALSWRSQWRCQKFFRHSCIYIRTDSGIHEPKDLKGKRVGTTQLGSTGVVFLNGMLQNEYGATIREIEWFIGGF